MAAESFIGSEGPNSRARLLLKRVFAIIQTGSTGKDIPLDKLLRDVLVGVIAGLLVHWIVRCFM